MELKKVTIKQISALSAFRTALVLSLAGLLAWLICVAVLYAGMQGAGVWNSLNSVIGGAGGEGTINFKVVMSAAGLVGAIVAVLISVLAPLGALIYNATVELFGGLEIGIEG